MSIYKRDKVWHLEFQTGGKRYRKTLKTRDKRVAQAFASQIKTAVKMPTFEDAVAVLRLYYKKPDDGVLPLDAAWDTYESLAKATGKSAVVKSTLRKRKSTLKRLTDWIAKNRPMVRTVEGVTGPVAAGFATFLAESGLKSKSRINVIADLSTIWKLLENASVGVRNPWASLRPQNTDGERGKAFSEEQERLVLDAAKKVGKQWFEICTIMRHTGLRYEDVALMTWDEIQGDVIRVKPKKTQRHGISVGIPIIDPIRKVLDSMKRIGNVMFPLHESVYGINSTRYKKLNFRDVLKEAGLEGMGFTVHSWRHTACSRLAAAGADLETRMQILGHSVMETSKRYDHDEHLESKRKALEKASSIS